MNKMLNQLRIDGDGKEKGIEDFDDLDDEDSDDEGTGWNKVRRVSKIYRISVEFANSILRQTLVYNNRVKISIFRDYDDS